MQSGIFRTNIYLFHQSLQHKIQLAHDDMNNQPNAIVTNQDEQFNYLVKMLGELFTSFEAKPEGHNAKQMSLLQIARTDLLPKAIAANNTFITPREQRQLSQLLYCATNIIKFPNELRFVNQFNKLYQNMCGRKNSKEMLYGILGMAIDVICLSIITALSFTYYLGKMDESLFIPAIIISFVLLLTPMTQSRDNSFSTGIIMEMASRSRLARGFDSFTNEKNATFYEAGVNAATLFYSNIQQELSSSDVSDLERCSTSSSAYQ